MPGQTTQPSSKVVRVSDLETLISAYAQIENTGTFGKWMSDAELQAIGKKGGGKGIYSDGKLPTASHLYVDSQFIRDGLKTIMDDPKVTAQQKQALSKVNETINEALDGCKDHSAEVKQGTLKPLVKAPAPK